MSSTRISNATLLPLDDDASYWWHTTAKVLANMLYQANYDCDSIQRNLLFYRSFIVPSMGSRPNSAADPSAAWKSYVTDDHSPIEYSWSWDGRAGNTPRVRFTIEPIGADSGSSADPYNQSMAKSLLGKLCKDSPDIDRTLHDHFEKELLSSTTNPSLVDARAAPQSHRSSMFVAIELEDAPTTVKTYFMPMIRALESNQTRAEVLFQAIRSLHRNHPNIDFPAFNGLIEYMANDALGSQTQVEMVAVDCVTLSMARVKIYLRSQETSWESLCRILTMNGHIQVTQRALEKMRMMWQLVFSLDEDFSTAQQLPTSHRSEAGTLYCFYARPGDTTLRCKLYIPVKYYGLNDRAIAQGLLQYFQRRGQDEFVNGYWSVLEGLCSHRPLDESCGIHTYISCEPKGDDMSVTSYFSPEIYHPIRTKR